MEEVGVNVLLSIPLHELMFCKWLRLCLVPEKYQEKKKNVKKNGFLIFSFTIIFFFEKIKYN